MGEIDREDLRDLKADLNRRLDKIDERQEKQGDQLERLQIDFHTLQNKETAPWWKDRPVQFQAAGFAVLLSLFGIDLSGAQDQQPVVKYEVTPSHPEHSDLTYCERFPDDEVCE